MHRKFGVLVFLLLLLLVLCWRKITGSLQARLMILLLLTLSRKFSVLGDVWSSEILSMCLSPRGFHFVFLCRLLCAWLVVHPDETSVTYTCELEFPSILRLVGENEITYKQILQSTIPGNCMLLWACLFSTCLHALITSAFLRKGADSLFKNLLQQNVIYISNSRSLHASELYFLLQRAGRLFLQVWSKDALSLKLHYPVMLERFFQQVGAENSISYMLKEIERGYTWTFLFRAIRSSVQCSGSIFVVQGCFALRP